VSWRGELVLERYFNRIRPTQLANIKSASMLPTPKTTVFRELAR